VEVAGGVDDDIEARAAEGCTGFYLYLRPG
jgi:hypothetical protein